MIVNWIKKLLKLNMEKKDVELEFEMYLEEYGA